MLIKLVKLPEFVIAISIAVFGLRANDQVPQLAKSLPFSCSSPFVTLPRHDPKLWAHSVWKAHLLDCFHFQSNRAVGKRQ